MPEIITLRKPVTEPVAPSGEDPLLIRERYLRRRNRHSHNNGRALAAFWVAVGALLSWIFVIGFAAFAH